VHFDVHEYFEGMLYDRAPAGLGPAFMWLGRRLMSFLVRRADWITAVSNETAEHLRACKPGAPIDLLYNSAPIERYPLCNQHGPGPLRVCHEGWLDHGTGMIPLLKAVALARREIDVRLVLVGKIRPWSQDAFEAAVRDLQLGEGVQCRGWIPYEHLGPAVAECQVGVVAMQPSLNNFTSLSNKLMSYMACGQAVVVPRGSASAALVQRYDCGLGVDSTSPPEIAAALVRLAHDGDERRRLGQNGRQAMEQHLGWHVMEELLRSRYAQLQAQGQLRQTRR
jgi:glycosyltransferase involved in cell wall biosynthesis